MDHLIAFFKTFENKDIATLIVATYGAVFSTLNFGWPRIKEWKESRKALFRALQGEKEAISDVAAQVIDGKLDAKLKRKRDFRIRLIKALSMAFVLESSDRAKAYVVAAFEYICRIDRTSKAELVSQLEAIERIFISYDGLVNDNDFRVKRLAKLQVVLAHVRKYGAPAA